MALITGYLPSIPLLGRDGEWDCLISLIKSLLLPGLEVRGEATFVAPLRPLPPYATIVPVVSESWSRPRRDGTPQFVYLVGGHGFMLVEDKLLALTHGQGFYLPKGILYAPYLMLGNRISPCDLLWFKVHPFGVVVLRSRLTPTAHYQSAHFVIAERRLADLFVEWEQEHNHPDTDHRLTKGLLMAFFGLLMRSLPFTPAESHQSEADLPMPLQSALAVLHRAYNKPITLKQLATYCGVTPEHLCRLFRRYLSVTPWQYLENLRLRVAHQLLQATGLSVADVAFLAGFNDLRHFQRLFRKTYGCAPSAIRHQKKRRSSRFLRVWG